MESFLTHFQKPLNELKIGDNIIVIGKDQLRLVFFFSLWKSIELTSSNRYKGWKGVITQYKRLSGEDIFTVELKANRMQIERLKSQLKKDF